MLSCFERLLNKGDTPMKIINLTEDSKMYTSNAFLVTGSWNTLTDINTLIDTGRDPNIIEKINNAATGVGKHKLDQAILTHSHYDHAGMVKEIKREFNSKILAYSKNQVGIDKTLHDGEVLKMGDVYFEVIHMPGHSTDSICLYSRESKVLFAGDSPLIIRTEECCYEYEFVFVLKRLVSLPIDIIYFGHGGPLIEKCNESLMQTLENITAKKLNC